MSPEKVDETWRTVREAIEAGKLWEQAKVSTRLSGNGKPHVICVYTYNYEDREDVMRVRDVLRKMGFNRKIPYKTDEATIAGMYGSGTSIYYE